MTVAEVLVELRDQKNLNRPNFIICLLLKTNDELIGTFNLRDLVVAEPDTTCK